MLPHPAHLSVLLDQLKERFLWFLGLIPMECAADSITALAMSSKWKLLMEAEQVSAVGAGQLSIPSDSMSVIETNSFLTSWLLQMRLHHT